MYGLDTISVNASVKASLDAFQIKGLRRILGLPSTYLVEHRHYTNEYVINEVNKIQAEKQVKPIVIFSTYHKNQRIKRLAKLITEGHNDPAAKATMDLDTWQEHDTGTRRAGRPRINWLTETMNDLWELTSNNTAHLQHAILDLNNEEQKTAMKEMAHRIMNKKDSPI